jgi:uncharacterized membrane protein YGL010W
MIRPRLLEWQWSDYSAKHRDQINLLLHIVAVSRFVAEQWITFPRFVFSGGWARNVGRSR